MRELHLKGLTPATAELVRPLLAWPDIQARWRGEMDTAALIRRIDQSGEVSAIPFLLTYAFAQNREVQTTARAAIERLYRLMTALELLPLDEALRTSWAHGEDWYGQKLPVRKLRPDESQDLIMLGLMCSHRSGFVRAEAITALGKSASNEVIPFLLVRLADWVDEVRRDADAELIKKIQPQFGGSFVRCLGLVEQLTRHSRFRLGYRDSIHNMLREPACASHVIAGLHSNDLTARRVAYVIACNNPALQVEDVIDQALIDQDVVIRSWVFSSGPQLSGAGGRDWAKLAIKDTFAPIRENGFDQMIASGATCGELTPFLFDRSTGLRRACQSILAGKFGLNAAEIYREIAQDDVWRRIEITALGLGETGTSQDGPALLDLLHHPGTRVRSAAVRALGALKIEDIDQHLLERIRSDRRSVARDAAIVLLQRKIVSPRSIWRAAEENLPDVQFCVLQQMWRVNKWIQLNLYLEASLSKDTKLIDFAVQRLEVWERHFNRSFVQPRSEEITALLSLLNRASLRLSAPVAKRIQFVLQSFGR